MKSLGLCIGSYSIGAVLLENKTDHVDVIKTKSVAHDGEPQKAVMEMIHNDFPGYPDKFVVTGRKFRDMLDASTISELEATEWAYNFIKDTQPTSILVSAGGESTLLYHVDAYGKIIDVTTGNKCASGTGEFFLQQIKRMDIRLQDISRLAETDNPYKVSGRCSVFCKSDCTHALNKGVARGNIVAGLCEMMACKILELLEKAKQRKQSQEIPCVMLIGGTGRNAIMMNLLKKQIPNLVVPQYAFTFEALGAALWGLRHETLGLKPEQELFKGKKSSFLFLPALQDNLPKVIFRESPQKKAASGDRLILGLDVGSTTTKAVLIDADAQDKKVEILASVYLRTNGDPVEASRQCYAALAGQVPEQITVIGLGVTGSGRQIAGLHSLTTVVINEIIAHANAAAYFDPAVDTIFEIGGQDAKYTYLVNGVAADYAMNEACSAGTGSFLEESIGESLKIKTEDIGRIALQSSNPADFNDQCSAFINSDIKTAIQEGIPLEDIAAGVVNSICVNYFNRVKGNRPVGRKVFMQGGVCYNKAVPVAMASLTGRDIVVPPEPGLMGAFGVALYVKNRIDSGLINAGNFDLQELAGRKVIYKEPFTCRGGNEQCDRKCRINQILLKEKVYAFGGACNRYYNLLYDKVRWDAGKLDYVQLREKMVFKTYGTRHSLPAAPKQVKSVGVSRSLLTNTYYPLYHNFFKALGHRVITGEEVDSEGVNRQGAAFCYSVEISHGALYSLLKQNPDILFMPNIKASYVENSREACVTCPFVSGESFYLLAAFPELQDKQVFNPVIDFARGYRSQENIFIKIGSDLGHKSGAVKKAYRLAVQAQKAFEADCRKTGRQILQELDNNPDEIGIVLFGRAYNAFSQMANKGIPHKIASRGYRIIPCDFLPYPGEPEREHAYWAAGEVILKAAGIVKHHPRLFGVYITNFSCGPDSFLLGYFRKEMGDKPSLILELDNHTADAGIDTRIEAFIDVIKTYNSRSKQPVSGRTPPYRPARAKLSGNSFSLTDSRGVKYKLTDPHVHLLLPSMGDNGSRAVAAVFRRNGVNAHAVPDPGEKELKLGLANTSGKECLPAIITTGSLLSYLQQRRNKDELLVYLMPGDSGPCRFGSYHIMMQNLIEDREIEDVAFLFISQEDGYMRFKTSLTLRLWQAIVITDTLEEIYSAVLVLSADKEQALQVYRRVCEEIISSLEKDSWEKVKQCLKKGAEQLNSLEKKQSFADVPQVALINEMYVRRNNLARNRLVEKFAEKNVLLKAAPLSEWMYYLDYAVKQGWLVRSSDLINKITKILAGFFTRYYEKEIKTILAGSGFYEYKLVDIASVINSVTDLFSPELISESIIVIGTTIREVAEHAAGVISILPFGCMPGRIAEAILNGKLNSKKLEVTANKAFVEKVMEQYPHLPFLSLEVDGKVFPPATEARLEIFLLQVERIHKEMRKQAGLVL